MSYIRTLRLSALAAGAAVGLMGFAAVTPAMAQQAPAWNGEPNATGPASDMNRPMYRADRPDFGPSATGYGPNYGGQAPGYGGNDADAAYGVRAPYWLGAPAALGPG